jgi:hypothetical protein
MTEASIESDGIDVFVVYNGTRIAKRGHPNTPQAYLNVPPARIPGEDGERLDDLPHDVERIRAALLDRF